MKELVIFDIDNTIIKGQSQRILLGFVFKKGIINFFYYLKILCWFLLYNLGIAKNPKRVMEYALIFLNGKDECYIEDIINEFFDKELKKYFFKEALELIDRHKKEGRKIVFVSTAIEPVIRKIAYYLGVKYYLATKLEIKNGRYTGKIDGEIVYGKNKINRLKDFLEKNNFSLKNSWAYGDHISDLDILEVTSHPIVVNPDRILYKEAKKRGWNILNFIYSC